MCLQCVTKKCERGKGLLHKIGTDMNETLTTTWQQQQQQQARVCQMCGSASKLFARHRSFRKPSYDERERNAERWSKAAFFYAFAGKHIYRATFIFSRSAGATRGRGMRAAISALVPRFFHAHYRMPSPKEVGGIRQQKQHLPKAIMIWRVH